MIPIVFKYFTPRGFRGFTFYPFIFMTDKKDKSNAVFINHEKIHIRQQLELLIFPFYIWYFTEFLVLWIRFKNKFEAYKNISFEKEAYHFENDFDYLKRRKLWSFLKFYN